MYERLRNGGAERCAAWVPREMAATGATGASAGACVCGERRRRRRCVWRSHAAQSGRAACVLCVQQPRHVSAIRCGFVESAAGERSDNENEATHSCWLQKVVAE